MGQRGLDARALAAEGFDVWTLDLRGSDDSHAPSVADWNGWTFTIDDFIRLDAPTAVDYVLAQSGAPQLFFCGHTLGGLVVYGPDERARGSSCSPTSSRRNS